MEPKGKTAIVTGAGGTIGRALAKALAEAGAKVVCVGRTMDPIRETAAAIAGSGGKALALQADVTKPVEVERMANEARHAYDRIDILINNAARFATIAPLWDADPEEWWSDVTVNLRGPMLCARAVVPWMLERGAGVVINLTGGSHIPGGTGYSCSKVALRRLTELLAKELESAGGDVFAFALGPGFVRSAMTERQIHSDAGRRWLPSSAENVNLGRDRPPEDCANAAVALIRAARPALNGHAFNPDSDFRKDPA